MSIASVLGFHFRGGLRLPGFFHRVLSVLPVLLILGWNVTLFPAQAAVSRSQRANVVVILADDLGWPDLGVQGAKDFKTPHIDSLATSGVRFKNGYVSAPVCSPSRAGLLTGRCQQRFGHEINPGPLLETNPVFGLPLTESTLGNRMKGLGYSTGWVGKSHQGALPQFYPLERGFDEFFGFLEGHHDYTYPYLTTPDDPIRRGATVVLETNYLTSAFARECVDFIDRHAQQPFLLYAPFNAVHFPMQATAEHLGRFDPAQFGGNMMRYTNAAMLAALDDAVGEILAKLRALNIESNTLICFTSDNGAPSPTGIDANGSINTPLKGYKGTLYEGGIRVPFLMQWKGVLAPRVEEAVVSTLDLLPTAVAAGGGLVPAAWQLDGVDLIPYLKGQTSEQPHSKLFWRMQTAGGEETVSAPSAVREGKWKAVKPGVASRWELYDLSTDISEARDLADAYPEVLAKLSSDFEGWESELSVPRWDYNTPVVVQPEYVRDDLRLGSVDVSYLWPDFLPDAGWMAFQDQDGVLWAGEVDRVTGRLKTATGRDVKVDSGLVPVPSYQGRAQWAWLPEGPALFYSKPGTNGKLQLWRAVMKEGAFVLSQLTSNPGVDHFGVRVPRESAVEPVRMLFNVGSMTGGSSLVWADATPSALQTPLLRPLDRAMNGSWLPGGEHLVYSAYPQPQATVPQLVRYTPSNAEALLVTSDLGIKADVSAFQSAELGGELLYAAVVNRTNVVVYRDMRNSAAGRFTNITSVTFPPTVDQRYISFLEPLDRSAGFNGVSYFTFASYTSPDVLNPIDSAIWVLGLGPDLRHPIIRRVDQDPDDTTRPAFAGRRDPRPVRGERELFVYYTQVDAAGSAQLRLAKTGIQLPDATPQTTSFTRMQFTRSFQSHTVDTNGWQMNPTETTHLISHAGMLFAGQSSLMFKPYPPVLSNPPPEWSGAQILVKTGPEVPWKVDHTLGLSPYPFHLRVDILKELKVLTDGNGTPVNLPDGILVAGLGDIGETGSKQASVRMRDDRTAVWKESHVTTASEEAYPLSFVSHQESGVTRLYVGLSNGQVHRGNYTLAGNNVAWVTNADFSGVGPVTGLVEANGVVYAACGLLQTSSDGPLTGGIYWRNDANKIWQLAYRWPYPTDLYLRSNDVRWLRGLTAVPEPHGDAYQVLLGARSWPGVIERVDPRKGYAATIELDVVDFLSRQWADPRVKDANITLGYQGFTSMTNPVTGERVHWLGIWVDRPWLTGVERGSAHYLIRHLDASYEIATIGLVENGTPSRAARCAAVSPFASDLPGTIYVGGYDVANEVSAYTGWIVRGDWGDWPTVALSQPNPPEWQLAWNATATDWVLEQKSSLSDGVPWQRVTGISTRSNTNQMQSVPPVDVGAYYRLRKP